MTVYLVTTTDMKGGRDNELIRLIQSVEANASSSPEELRLVLLLQNCTPVDFERISKIAPKNHTMLATADRCSLSAARNQILQKITADGCFQDHDIIGFPDDDCWLPNDFIKSLVLAFHERPMQKILFCRSSLRPDEGGFEPDEAAVASIAQIVRLSSSNNVFYRGSIINAIGRFDPELGLGTLVGGSEDTDFIIRATLHAGEAFFIDRKLVGHVEPCQASAARYFQSSLVVLAKYAHRRPRLAVELLRKLCVGLVFAGRGTLSFSFFTKSVLLAIRRTSGPNLVGC